MGAGSVWYIFTVRLKAYPDTNPFLLRKRRERLWKARKSRFPSTSASLGSGLRQKQGRLSPLKRFGMTKRKRFSGSHDQSSYGATEGVGHEAYSTEAGTPTPQGTTAYLPTAAL